MKGKDFIIESLPFFINNFVTMKLQQQIIDQLKSVFSQIENKYTFVVSDNASSKAEELKVMMTDFVSSSDKFDIAEVKGENLRLDILKNGEKTNISFRAIPSGHEFTSLILAVVNLDGKGKNMPDDVLSSRIRRIKGNINITTYASLSCTNCPDVVQALNIISVINPNIRHEMVDGALYQSEVNELNVAAVPTVYANGELLHVGKSNLGELLLALEQKFGKDETSDVIAEEKNFDLIVVGGGPSGVTSAIYSARKGLNVAIVAEKVGGQVNETTAIENIPSVVETHGQKLAGDLRIHAEKYNITILEGRKAEKFEDGDIKTITTSFQEILKAPQVIISTGASWRRLGVEGEAEHIGKGVAFCPHCDGPFFAGKDIAVIGGGNSGIEAAIDLAGICKSVKVVEFAETLKADQVLQDKLHSLKNVEVYKNMATKRVIGDGSKISAIEVEDRATKEVRTFDLDGVFVQIGLSANTSVFKDVVETNRIGEIVVDERCRTSKKGIYASGDCTTVPYKQIVIAMGEGAKAALTAFDDRMRGF